MRLFLAIDLDADSKEALSEAIAPVRAAAPDLAWVREHKLHLTLRFLGEQPDAAAARIGPVMDLLAARHRAFDMRLRHVGAFPNFRRARVVWIGVEPSARLELLHHDVELACEQLGFGIEGRPFRPHVTLARVRERVDDAVRRSLARAARRVAFERDVVVERVDLMRSTPGDNQSTYERLNASPLGTR